MSSSAAAPPVHPVRQHILRSHMCCIYSSIVSGLPINRMECIIEQQQSGFCDPNAIYEGLKIQVTSDQSSSLSSSSYSLHVIKLSLNIECFVYLQPSNR